MFLKALHVDDVNIVDFKLFVRVFLKLYSAATADTRTVLVGDGLTPV
jgi:hypothetical protein